MTESEAKQKRDEAYQAMTASPSQDTVDRYVESVKDYDQAIDEARAAEKKSLEEAQKLDAEKRKNIVEKTSMNDGLELSEAQKFGKRMLEAMGNASNFVGDTPVEVAQQVVAKRAEASGLRALCTVHAATGDYAIPVEGDGITVSYVAENGTIGEANPTAPAKILKAYKLAAIAKLAREAAEDPGFDVIAWLTDLFGRSFASMEEKEFLLGTGVADGHITGIITALGKSTSQVVTAASAATITYDELMRTIDAAGKYLGTPNDAIIVNRSTLTQLKLLKDGGGHYIFAQGEQLSTIDGLKVCVVPAMPDVATGTTPVVVGNMGYYHIADRRGFNVRVLQEIYASSDQIGVSATERIDAMPTQLEAFAMLKMA